jgi:hypothetical protein
LFAKISTHINPLTSSIDSRSHASSISRIKQGGPHQRNTYYVLHAILQNRMVEAGSIARTKNGVDLFELLVLRASLSV